MHTVFMQNYFYRFPIMSNPVCDEAVLLSLDIHGFRLGIVCLSLIYHVYTLLVQRAAVSVYEFILIFC